MFSILRCRVRKFGSKCQLLDIFWKINCLYCKTNKQKNVVRLHVFLIIFQGHVSIYMCSCIWYIQNSSRYKLFVFYSFKMMSTCMCLCVNTKLQKVCFRLNSCLMNMLGLSRKKCINFRWNQLTSLVSKSIFAIIFKPFCNDNWWTFSLISYTVKTKM